MSQLSVVPNCRLGAFRNEAEEKTPPEKSVFNWVADEVHCGLRPLCIAHCGWGALCKTK